MLNNPAFAADKNKLWGDAYLKLFEVEYAPGQFARYARAAENITFQGHLWLAANIAPVETTETSSGEIPTFPIVIDGAGRAVTALSEQYRLEGCAGRIVTVRHDAYSDPTACVEEHFTIDYVLCDTYSATVTCRMMPFDLLTTLLPADVITAEEFPGAAMPE